MRLVDVGDALAIAELQRLELARVEHAGQIRVAHRCEPRAHLVVGGVSASPSAMAMLIA